MSAPRVYPLSPFQAALLADDALAPGAATGPAYTLNAVLHTVGPLDLDRLGDAADALIARQDVLRTRYPVLNGERVQQVVAHRPRRGRSALTIVDAAPGTADLQRRAEALAATPVPWDEPPVARVIVERLGDDEHLVALVVHHLSVDAASLHLAVTELARTYDEPDVAAPPLPLTYGGYVAWQRQRQNGHARAHLDAWTRALAGARPPAYRRDHPFRRGTPAEPRVVREVVAAPDAVRRLDDWSRRNRSTALATLLAAFARTLAGETADRELLVVTALEQRDHPDTRGLVGSFIHPVILRIGVRDGEPWAELAARVRDAVVDTYPRAQVPPDRQLQANPVLVPGAVGLSRSWVRFFEYLPARGTDRYRFGPATATLVASSGHRVGALEYALGLRVRRTHEGGLVGRLAFDATELTGAHAGALLDRFRACVQELAAT